MNILNSLIGATIVAVPDENSIVVEKVKDGKTTRVTLTVDSPYLDILTSASQSAE